MIIDSVTELCIWIATLAVRNVDSETILQFVVTDASIVATAVCTAVVIALTCKLPRYLRSILAATGAALGILLTVKLPSYVILLAPSYELAIPLRVMLCMFDAAFVVLLIAQLPPYYARRILWMVPTLLGITLMTFVVVQLAPGDPVKISMGEGSGDLKTRNLAEEIRKEQSRLLGLDKPLWQRYPVWLWKILKLDLGRSYRDWRPVTELIAERLPVTLTLNLVSIFLAYIIAIPIGVYSAVRSGRLSDHVITVILFILYSLPSFWLAYILIYFFAGGSYYQVFPVGGLNSLDASQFGPWKWLVDRLWHLILPVICLTYASFAGLSRYTRSGMMEILRQDYIRTARAKGLPERLVVLKHAMRNSLIPIVTIFAGLLPAVIGGSVIIETIFNIPGLGRLAYDAVLFRDYPVIMAEATIGAVLTLVGILLSDILYAVIDPRIKYD